MCAPGRPPAIPGRATGARRGGLPLFPPSAGTGFGEGPRVYAAAIPASLRRGRSSSRARRGRARRVVLDRDRREPALGRRQELPPVLEPVRVALVDDHVDVQLGNVLSRDLVEVRPPRPTRRQAHVTRRPTRPHRDEEPVTDGRQVLQVATVHVPRQDPQWTHPHPGGPAPASERRRTLRSAPLHASSPLRRCPRRGARRPSAPPPSVRRRSATSRRAEGPAAPARGDGACGRTARGP